MKDLFAKLAEETRRIEVSAELESKLLREFDTHRRRRGTMPLAIAAALAACVIGAFWLKPKPVPPARPQMVRITAPASASPPPHEQSVRRRRTAKPRHAEPEFIRIPYSAPLAPYERAEIVRMDLPVSALSAAGIQIATADAGARAQADVMIGQDGMAHAVRVISVSSNY